MKNLISYYKYTVFIRNMRMEDEVLEEIRCILNEKCQKIF
jgi:hypothetical protein